jgi:hypothetical protein
MEKSINTEEKEGKKNQASEAWLSLQLEPLPACEHLLSAERHCRPVNIYLVQSAIAGL